MRRLFSSGPPPSSCTYSSCCSLNPSASCIVTPSAARPGLEPAAVPLETPGLRSAALAAAMSRAIGSDPPASEGPIVPCACVPCAPAAGAGLVVGGTGGCSSTPCAAMAGCVVGDAAPPVVDAAVGTTFPIALSPALPAGTTVSGSALGLWPLPVAPLARLLPLVHAAGAVRVTGACWWTTGAPAACPCIAPTWGSRSVLVTPLAVPEGWTPSSCFSLGVSCGSCLEGGSPEGRASGAEAVGGEGAGAG